MIGGVSFQPQDATGQTDPKLAPQSVQEAIKVLSLRLPKTVGARSIAPGALLNAQGSGGNPRVDSVVNQVLSRMFPTGAAPGGAPVVGQTGQNGTMPVSPPVRYDGNARPPGQTPLSSMMPPVNLGGTPNITFDHPNGPITPGTPTPPGTMLPDEWRSPPPPPPPGFDGTVPKQDGPLMGVPETTPPDDNMALMNFLWKSAPPAERGRRGY